MTLDIVPIARLSESTLAIARHSGLPSPFYSRDLLSVWESVFGWQGIVLQEGDIVMIGFVKQTSLGNIFYSLPFGWYGGIVGSDLTEQLTASILDRLQEQRYIEERVVQLAGTTGTTYPGRYQRRTLTTHVLDLTVAAPYSENTVRNVRKAQQENLITRRLGIADVASVEALREEHIARTGEKRRLADTFYAALYLLTQSEDSGVTMVGAFKDDRLLAVHFYFVSETDVFYFDGYSSAAGLDLGANFFLFDVMIARSRDFGRRRFNFGASPEGDEGLKRFKTGWGAEPFEYYEYSRRDLRKRAIDFVRGRR
jgi:hypothetical protein